MESTFRTSFWVLGGDGIIVSEAKNIGLEITSADSAKFIFVLHTVYAILIKHIALMILQARKFGQYKLYEDSQHTALDEISKTVEDGTMFTNLGVSNFMEGDFFCWYVLEWNHEINSAIKQLISLLNNYEPSTALLKPEVVRDLLKELYQGLLTKNIRHNLGEYYTPDWLAEITITHSNYCIEDKVLDPSCGSGTFLVLHINRTISEMKDTHSPEQIIEHI